MDKIATANSRITMQPKRNAETLCRLEELPDDLKRMLRVQWKEFYHYIDDSMSEDYISHLRAA